MTLKIPTRISTSLGDSSDAISMFNTAVTNGQARLAMEILIDIINGLANKIESLESVNPSAKSEPAAPQETVTRSTRKPVSKASSSKASDSDDEVSEDK